MNITRPLASNWVAIFELAAIPDIGRQLKILDSQCVRATHFLIGKTALTPHVKRAATLVLQR
jgi:hypothetical protein